MKFIKQIIEFFNALFANKEVIESKKIENLDYILKDIDDWIEQVNIGDIIWAKRYETEKEKELIPEGHREGPYIVLDKVDKELICSKGTSSERYEKRINDYFELDNERYNYLSKKTYFKLYQLENINSVRFIKNLDSLKDNDLENLFKSFKRRYKDIDIKYPLQCGDIIINNNINYLIIDINNDKLVCIPLNINIKNLKFENFKNLDYSKLTCLENNVDYKIINNVTDNILLYVLKKHKEYIENYENQKVTQRGSVIYKENKYYYVYGEEGQDWLTFEISKINISDFYKLKIKDTEFFTDFSNVKINKKETFETIFLCTNEEIDNLKNLRKEYKQEQKMKQELEATKNLRFNVGDIIESIYYKNKRYIIIKVCSKTYECLSIEKIKKAIYDPVLIIKKDSVLSKNTSIEGIKWLELYSNFKMDSINQKNNLDKIFEMQKRYLEEQQQEKIDIITECIEYDNNSNDITKGSTIKCNEFSEEEFVVKHIMGNIVVCVSCVDRTMKNPKKHYFNKDDVIIVKNKQKRK